MLDHVRPTVVRRRVYEPPQQPPQPQSHLQSQNDEDDEDGPPSSVNVARALASLRGHELKRLEEILGAPDDGEDPQAPSVRAVPSAPPVPSAPATPTVRVGATIAVAELARRMSVSVQEVVTALVTRGFFSVTVKSALPRETARAAATLFGWQVEESDEVEPPPAKAKKTTAAAAKASSAAKPKAATKAAPKKKARAATTADRRRTSRRA
jgi:hypothetical protein